MKKLVLPLLIIGVIFGSCKKEKELGSVTLDPASKTIVFDDIVQLKPEFSATGEARNKTYIWKSNADSIASVKPAMSGGTGEVRAKRIGEAKITYVSTDGLVSATSNITVSPRSNILNGLYYKKGVTASEISNNIAGQYVPDLINSTERYKIYTAALSTTITHLIYELNGSGKLDALWVVIKNIPDNRTNTEHYIQERFVMTGKSQDSINFFKNTGLSVFPINTVLGIFLNKEIEGTTYPYGVKIMDVSFLP
ncbi:MAG: Ig domain-containing protein [Porphyromonadaceae bacterium]|nr:Ig domain-containing protein [Porphyromonadaceae bacterium]